MSIFSVMDYPRVGPESFTALSDTDFGEHIVIY